MRRTFRNIKIRFVKGVVVYRKVHQQHLASNLPVTLLLLDNVDVGERLYPVFVARAVARAGWLGLLGLGLFGLRRRKGSRARSGL